MLEVDFPNGKEQSKAVKKQNGGLSKAFGIEAFPTLMLCDAEGRPYTEAGFPDEMNPEDMMKQLKTGLKAKAKRDAVMAKAGEAKGVEKAKLLVEALGLVPAATVSGAYAGVIDEIAKLDPEDKTGFVTKAKTERALGELEASFGELMEAEKSDDAIKLVDDFIKNQKPEGEAKQKALMFKVFGFADTDRFKEAIKVADEVIKIDGKTETAKMVKQIRKQLKSEE